jgi:hypothetical protein
MGLVKKAAEIAPAEYKKIFPKKQGWRQIHASSFLNDYYLGCQPYIKLLQVIFRLFQMYIRPALVAHPYGLPCS